MRSGDPVDQVALDHAQPAGRGQGWVNVNHARVFSGRWMAQDFPSCGRDPLVSSQAVRVKNLMAHNI